MHTITSQSSGLYFAHKVGDTGGTIHISLTLIESRKHLAIVSSEIAPTLFLDGIDIQYLRKF